MALQQIPQASAGGAAFPSAGSLVASAFSTNLYYKTTLAAGTYYFYGIAEGSPTHMRGQLGHTSPYTNPNRAGSTPSSSAMFSMGAYDEFTTFSIPSGTPAVFTLSTSREVMFSAGIKYIHPHAQFGTANLTNSPSHSMFIPFMTDNVISDYYPVGGYNRDSQGYRFAIVRMTGPNKVQRVVTYQSYALTTTTAEAPSCFAEFNNVFFVGYGTGSTANKFYRSTDGGTSWSNISPTGLNNSVQKVAWSGTTLSAPNANFVVVSDSGTSGNNLASSTDGITWTTRASGLGNALYCVAYSSTLGRWVAGGGGGVIATSDDGITWTARTSPQTSLAWTNATWNATAGKFLLHTSSSTNESVNYNGAYSTDGVTWTATRIANHAYVTDSLLTSTNLTRFAEAQQPYLTKLMTIDGLFVGWTQYNNTIYLSTDAISWSHTKVGDYNNLMVAFHYSSTYGFAINVPKENVDDYNGQTICYPQAATYQIYSSTIV